MKLLSVKEVMENQILREQALDYYRNSALEYNDWYMVALEDFILEVEKKGFDVLINSIEFTIGDRNEFTAFDVDWIDIERLIDRSGIKFRLGLEQEFIDSLYELSVTKQHRYWNHVSTFANVTTSSVYSKDGNYCKKISEYFEEIGAKLQQYLQDEIDIMKADLLDSLTKEYEYLNSDEATEIFIENNIYMFEVDEDGNLVF